MRGAGRDRVGRVRGVMAAHLPGYRVRTVVPLGEGEDNIAYEVNAELILRFAKEPDPARRAATVDGEARLLATVAAVATLPVPTPVFGDPEQGCLGYAKLPGVPLIDLPPEWRSAHGGAIAAEIGELISALRGAPAGLADQLADLVGTDDQPNVEWLREAAETYAGLAPRVPPAHRPAVEAFLATRPPPDGTDLAFCHNDLGIEHVLVDPATATVTGVIDWGDAAITDPARDLGLVHRDLGPGALDRALRGYRCDAREVPAIRSRAGFYARCGLLEDMAYGMRTGRRAYLDNSLAALAWLYPER